MKTFAMSYYIFICSVSLLPFGSLSFLKGNGGKVDLGERGAERTRRRGNYGHGVLYKRRIYFQLKNY